MKIYKKEDKEGFTIIEVVLVLAIAALIFLMVFIALPALQRSQRDTQRKNDLNRAITAINNYTTNNRGTLPTLNAAFIKSYLTTSNGDTFLDPSGANTGTPSATTYTFKQNLTLTAYPTSWNSASVQNTIYYAPVYTCGSGGTLTKAGSRKIALRIALEGGGVACQSN